jgi:hypothetical protein
MLLKAVHVKISEERINAISPPHFPAPRATAAATAAAATHEPLVLNILVIFDMSDH